jgi:hypothetical protein
MVGEEVNEKEMMVEIPVIRPKLMHCICEGAANGPFLSCQECQSSYHF